MQWPKLSASPRLARALAWRPNLPDRVTAILPKNLPISVKMPLGIALLCLTVAGATAFHSYFKSSSVIRDQTIARFELMLDDRKDALESWLFQLSRNTLALAKSRFTRAATMRFIDTWDDFGADAGRHVREWYQVKNPHPLGAREMFNEAEDKSRYSTVHERYHNDFADLRTGFAYDEIFLVDRRGYVIYSVTKQDSFGTNVFEGPYADSGLATAVRDALKQEEGHLCFVDFDAFEAQGGASAAFIASPLFDPRGDKIGAIVVQVSERQVSTIMAKDGGLGKTGTVMIVGKDMLTRNASRQGAGYDMLQSVEGSEQVRAALAGERRIFRDTPGPLGQSVLAVTNSVSFAGTTWGLVAQQDATEAFASITALRRNLMTQLPVIAIVVGVLGSLLAHTMTGRLKFVDKALRRLAQEDYDIDIPQSAVNDEIGRISKQLEDLTSKLKIAKETDEELAVQRHEQDRVVELLRVGLNRLAAGDLTHKIRDSFDPKHEVLRKDFNATVDTLCTAMDSVIERAQTIGTGAKNISNASDDLSQRTENQAATLEETAAALDELTQSVKDAADGAKQVEGIVAKAQRNASDSGRVVDDAVAAMSEIKRYSDSISKIIGVIEDIAFQTNLLALNAGVEAARAGDVGKGFAVVASEVRALAQRSSESAKEIKALIDDSSLQVGRGVELVGETGEAITSIVDQITNIAALVSDIASGAVEQSSGLGEINIGVTQLDQVTQQNAAMAEDATAAGFALNAEATQLNELIATFKTKDQSTSAQLMQDGNVVPFGKGWTAGTDMTGSKPPAAPEAKPAHRRSEDHGIWKDF
ncbi:methyl-accepting chemotaxis protein [Litoreibacter roseus]|uniref:Methyl-accepting chemotaxis protein n=1 Tax=Litoreibacter roseus TaxID=2601869 RepID=A0A6N6JAE2_9RHOB|nr:methyl-accepting chemotaxis protein [Litoreibacter roseus]GFE63004.1 hypothetical protein KIN_00780 [Litoreibacter roseus]